MGQRRTDLSDMQLLEIMDLMDNRGFSAAAVAERFGRSRGSILGLRHRILTELKQSEVGPGALQPENRDGGMPPGWWRARRAVT